MLQASPVLVKTLGGGLFVRRNPELNRGTFAIDTGQPVRNPVMKALDSRPALRHPGYGPTEF